MELTALPSHLGLQIFRDGSFKNVGFLGDRQQSKLVFVESKDFAKALRQDSGVNCVLTTPDLAAEVGSEKGIALTENPRLSFALIHNFLALKTNFYGRPERTLIDASARIHDRALVSKTGAVIGPRCKIEANAWIGDGVSLGSGVHVHPGAVLGATGLQVMELEDGTLDLTHAGRLLIDDGVVVMTNAVVAKALFRETTTIGAHARIGNLVFISHNVQIGARTIIGHNAVVNGNVVIGEAVWIGPNSTISNNLTLGDGAQVSLGSAVIRDIAKGQRFSGVFAVEHGRMLRHLATFSGPSSREPSGID